MPVDGVATIEDLRALQTQLDALNGRILSVEQAISELPTATIPQAVKDALSVIHEYVNSL